MYIFHLNWYQLSKLYLKYHIVPANEIFILSMVTFVYLTAGKVLSVNF